MFGNKKEKEKELGSKVLKWWQDLPYLKKLEIILLRSDHREGFEGYPEYNITAIEDIGVRTFWNYNNLEQKKAIMDLYEKEKEKERS